MKEVQKEETEILDLPLCGYVSINPVSVYIHFFPQIHMRSQYESKHFLWAHRDLDHWLPKSNQLIHMKGFSQDIF